MIVDKDLFDKYLVFKYGYELKNNNDVYYKTMSKLTVIGMKEFNIHLQANYKNGYPISDLDLGHLINVCNAKPTCLVHYFNIF